MKLYEKPVNGFTHEQYSEGWINIAEFVIRCGDLNHLQ